MTTPEVTEVTPPRHRITLDPFAGDGAPGFVAMPDIVRSSLLAVPVYQSEEPKR